MSDAKERLLHQLEGQIEFLELALKDPDVKKSLIKLLDKEMDFQNLLLQMEEEVPPESNEKLGEKAKKSNINWKDWIKKIFNKLNSLITSGIPGLGGKQ